METFVGKIVLNVIKFFFRRINQHRSHHRQSPLRVLASGSVKWQRRLSVVLILNVFTRKEMKNRKFIEMQKCLCLRVIFSYL